MFAAEAMSSSTACSILVCVVALAMVVKAIYEHRLLINNPESWRAMKAAQEDAKERKRNAMGKGAVGAARIARMFMKK